MRIRVNVAGKTINKIKFIDYAYTNKNKKAVWNCKCFCGKLFQTYYSSIKSGNTKSCGCMRYLDENRKWKRSNKHMYDTWIHMVYRCYNKNDPQYFRYGARGIKIYKKWKTDFNKFCEWINDNLGPKPNKDYSLDRINNDGNYTPGNLRWASKSTQSNNKDSRKLCRKDIVKIRNSDLSKEELAIKYNVKKLTIYRILNYTTWKNIE